MTIYNSRLPIGAERARALEFEFIVARVPLQRSFIPATPLPNYPI